MKIKHRASVAYDASVISSLDRIGIKYKKSSGIRILHFDVYENSSEWNDVKPLLRKWKIETICNTVFTNSELKSAKWLSMKPTWHHGYPKPEDGYLSETYDSASRCAKCGYGKKQRDLFRIHGEPKWGKKDILQLNWVFDEFFVTPELWESVFKPLGIECRPVIAHRTGKELETVVQLRIEEVLSHHLDMGKHGSRACRTCKNRKYEPFTRGMFPAISKEPSDVHAVKSKEWFGSGASAYKAIIVSQDVFSAIFGQNVKGVRFMPLAS